MSMPFTPNDLKKVLERKEEAPSGWTEAELASHWQRHLELEPLCEHHCCCCCNGLAIGEHF